MASKIFESAEFSIIKGYVKAVAKENGHTELTTLDFLQGVALALRANVIKLAPEIFGDDVRAQLAALIEGKAISQDVKGPLSDEVSMNLSAELNALLSEAGASDSLEFALKHILAMYFKNVKLAEEAAALNALVNQVEFKRLCGFASAVAGAHGCGELTTDLYLAGAWVAYQTGALKDNLTLSAHIAEHAKQIELLIQKNGWDQLDTVKLPVNELLPCASSFNEAMQNAVKKEQPLMALINEPVTAAVKLGERIGVAYHEAGHALVSLVLRPNVRIVKATIRPEGNAGGYVHFNGIGKGNSTKEDFREDLCVALAGQAAQVLKFGQDAADTGAYSDYGNATLSTWRAITVHGLDDEFGPVMLNVLSQDEKRPVTSGWLFDEAQRRLQQVMKDAYKQTLQILKDNEIKLNEIAQLLIEKETISEEEMRQCLAR
jgi:hypothetical protein